jgi:NAD-dependent SIR2 family protein deacetylase
LERRIAVFLGAGASRPLGYPVTDSILPAIWSGLLDGGFRRWPGLRGRRGASRFAGRLRRLLVILLPGLESGRPPEGASIVDVISLLDQLIMEGRTPHPDLSEAELRQTRVLLDLGINAVLQGRKRREMRDKLVAWLLSEAVRPEWSRVTLISTNYDTAVEQGLYRHLIAAPTSVGRHVDLGIAWRDAYRDLTHTRPRRARLAVFKLHGSLNWLRCETCGYIFVNVQQRIASLEFRARLSPYNECRCGGRLRSVVVTPSVVRDVRDANLLSTWNAALEDLRLAHEWIFIGYSLPSEDIAIRSLLLRAYHTRRRRKTLRIRVVQWEDPDRDPRRASVEYQRYRLLFPEAHLKEADYHRTGVEAFVKGLRPLAPAALQRRIGRVFPRTGRAWLREGGL